MKKKVSFKLALGLAICAMFTVSLVGLSTDAGAASWDAGDWKVSMGGNINAFYVNTSCDNSDIESGATFAGLACAGCTDKNGDYTSTGSVQNGLLPASLNFSAATNQEGWDISATINVYYGINTAGANGDGAGVLGEDNDSATTTQQRNSDALKFSSVDARQVYLTFGKKDFGTVKMGRDFGLFGLDAILNDMSLLGVGAGFVASNPGHTTLGGLGFGYVYTDRLTQIDYSTPNWAGFQGTLGIFQGFDGNGANSAETPGYHAKVAYSWDGVVKGMVSATYLNQAVITTGDGDVGDIIKDENIQGYDVFAKASIADFSLLGYYFSGEGMTSLAIGGLVFPGFDLDTGDPEEVSGYMAQATYTIGKTRLGINYSSNEQDKVYKVENTKATLGVYYNLTPALTLLGEYSALKSELKPSGLTDEVKIFTLGAILFF